MRKFRILMLAAICMVMLAAAGTAAGDDMTWGDLKQAMTTSSTISLDNDVIASAGDEMLVVPSGVTVTLDLNSHTISRGLTEVTEDGSVILVQGTLTVRDSGTGGRITGGFAELGGGILNDNGGTLIIESGSIEGNSALYDGGIYNVGSLAMCGGTVTGNTAGRYGGGVLLSISNSMSVSMQGTPVVWDNTPSNLYLPENKKITITNVMDTGARIGITSPGFMFTFTEHYHDFAQAVPTAFFFSDVEGCRISRNGYHESRSDSYEARWETIVTYFNTNEYGHRNTTLDANYTLVTSDTKDMTSAWYVVRGTVTVNHRLNVEDGAGVNIILLNGAVLKATDGICVDSDSSLSIYGESEANGQLIAKGSSYGAGIGGKKEKGYGRIYIHSGKVSAEGNEWAAGIGGALNANNGSGLVVIYGGNVTAEGGKYAPGIGGGGCHEYNDYGDIGRLVFYGGTVNATGGYAAAGIGSGYMAKNRGSMEIHGGVINAYGVAGIGGGSGAANDNVTVLITGGRVYAKGKYAGAGIGGASGGGDDEGNGNKVSLDWIHLRYSPERYCWSL